MTEIDHKFFVNADNRSLVLGREYKYKQGITFRIINHTDLTMTPIIGLGDTFTEVDSTLTGTAIVPKGSCTIQLPAIDSNDDLFDEQYIFLDYQDVVGDVLGLGLEFDIMQDTSFEILHFVDEGVQDAFTS